MYDVSFQARVILEAIKGESTLAEISDAPIPSYFSGTVDSSHFVHGGPGARDFQIDLGTILDRSAALGLLQNNALEQPEGIAGCL